MCGRFVLVLSWQDIFNQLDGFLASIKYAAIDQIENAPARFNIAPTQPILVIKRAGGNIEPELFRWGLVPEWVDDPGQFPLIINARSETLAEKASFKVALKNRRCIIPASGYYEWKTNKSGQKKPLYITPKDGQLFLMAGLYSTWVGPDGEEVDTAAVITVPANRDMKSVHARTPAMLSGKDVGHWLDTAGVNAKNAHDLLRGMPLGTTRVHAVSARVNAPRNDDPGLILEATGELDDIEDVENRPEADAPGKDISRQLDLF